MKEHILDIYNGKIDPPVMACKACGFIKRIDLPWSRGNPDNATANTSVDCLVKDGDESFFIGYKYLNELAEGDDNCWFRYDTRSNVRECYKWITLTAIKLTCGYCETALAGKEKEDDNT